MNFDGMFNLNFDLGDKFPTTEDVLLGDMTGVVDTLMHYNNFTPDFISHMEELSQPSFSNNINAVQMLTTLNMNVATKKNNQYEAITTKNYSIPNMADEMAMMMPATDLWSELVDNKDFIDDQYDLLCGTYPQSANEVVLFVDQYNSVIDYYLLELGLIESIADVENGKIPFDSLLGHEFRIISNQVAYEKIPATTTLFDKYSAKKVFTDTEYENGIEVKISGIMRIKENTSSGSASSTIGYTSELTELLIKNELSDKSDIVKLIENNTTTIDGYEFIPDISTGSFTMASVATTTLESLGATTYPSTIKVFPKDFESKNVIKNHITEYNNEVTDILNNLEDGETSDLTTIIYLDAIEMMVSSMNTVIASVSYVLIAFTSISLVVSSVMIGIITYVSVIERTKEIGVLRSIGARKKDISRVFNAETILIGFTAGMIAITFTYLISIPINIIVYSLLEVPNISSLNPIAAAILVSISVILTLIAGLVPSSIAAKKDPVTALRSE
ncbi:MAG: ABC transporter permease, partial [bacterium]